MLSRQSAPGGSAVSCVMTASQCLTHRACAPRCLARSGVIGGEGAPRTPTAWEIAAAAQASVWGGTPWAGPMALAAAAPPPPQLLPALTPLRGSSTEGSSRTSTSSPLGRIRDALGAERLDIAASPPAAVAAALVAAGGAGASAYEPAIPRRGSPLGGGRRGGGGGGGGGSGGCGCGGAPGGSTVSGVVLVGARHHGDASCPPAPPSDTFLVRHARSRCATSPSGGWPCVQHADMCVRRVGAVGRRTAAGPTPAGCGRRSSWTCRSSIAVGNGVCGAASGTVTEPRRRGGPPRRRGRRDGAPAHCRAARVARADGGGERGAAERLARGVRGRRRRARDAARADACPRRCSRTVSARSRARGSGSRAAARRNRSHA